MQRFISIFLLTMFFAQPANAENLLAINSDDLKITVDQMSSEHGKGKVRAFFNLNKRHLESINMNCKSLLKIEKNKLRPKKRYGHRLRFRHNKKNIDQQSAIEITADIKRFKKLTARDKKSAIARINALAGLTKNAIKDLTYYEKIPFKEALKSSLYRVYDELNNVKRKVMRGSKKDYKYCKKSSKRALFWAKTADFLYFWGDE